MTSSTNSPLIENREYPRLRYSAPVEVKFRQPETGGFGEPVKCLLSHDISRSGMRVFSSLPLDDEEICVCIKTSKNVEVIRVARIVRCVTQANLMLEYGLEFKSLLPEDFMIELEEESRRESIDPEFLLS